MNLTGLDFFFWVAGFVLNTALLIVLWRCQRAKQLPFFTAIISLAVAKTIVLYLLRSYGTREDYAYAYWTLTIADMLLQFGVVYEVASRVFRPVDTWAADVRGLLSWVTSLSVAAAVGLACLSSPPARTWVASLVARGDLFAAALMSEMFVAMMVISASAGLPWKSHAGAIARGLGAYCLLGVLIETGHAVFGVGRDVPAFLVLSHVRMGAYLVCALYWIVSLSSQEQEAREMSGEMRAIMLSLQTQTDANLRFLRVRKSR